MIAAIVATAAIAATAVIAATAAARPRPLPSARRGRRADGPGADARSRTDARSATGHVPGANRLTLDATLAERGDLRYTPAGIPAIDCVLQHASVQAEAGGERKVECELAAVAFGEPAMALAGVPAGTRAALRGIPRAPLPHRNHRRAARQRIRNARQRMEGNDMPRPMGRLGKKKDGKKRERGNALFKRRKFCRFTAEGVKEIDYKDIDVLKDFVQENGKIMPARITGTKARYQRQLSTPIKRARFLALLPYTDLH